MKRLGSLGITMRGLDGEQDLARIVDLFNSCAAMDPLENATSVEELRSDLSRPEVDAARNALLVESVDRLLGFAALRIWQGDNHVDVDLWIRTVPDVAPRIETEMIRWAEERAGETARRLRIPLELAALVGESRPHRAAVLAALGYEPNRYFFRMSRSLQAPFAEPSFPSGYAIRSIMGLDEMPQWVDALNDSFADHWHFHPHTLDQTLHFVRHDPNYRSDGDLVVVGPDGSIAGICQCVIRANENAVTGRREGWIGLLGVRREHRHIGIGRAALLVGLRWLEAEGMACALLGVDAASPTGALRLYQSAGFEVVHRQTSYSRLVSPATGAS